MCHRDPVLCQTCIFVYVCACSGERERLFYLLTTAHRTISLPKHVKNYSPLYEINIHWSASLTPRWPEVLVFKSRTAQSSNPSDFIVMYRGAQSCCDSLVCAAEAMSVTQGDVGLVHRLDVRLCCRDNIVTVVPTAHPPPARDMLKDKFTPKKFKRSHCAYTLMQMESCVACFYVKVKYKVRTRR